MLKHKKQISIKPFIITYLSLLMMSCYPLQETNNLLLITTESSKSINHHEYNVQLTAIANNREQDNLYSILSNVLWIENAKHSVISINKNQHLYDAVIIYDDVPADDSVSGYRYDIKVRRNNKAWEFIDLKQSWRCWEGRGHRAFSVLPCT